MHCSLALAALFVLVPFPGGDKNPATNRRRRPSRVASN